MRAALPSTPSFSDLAAIQQLPDRSAPYWNILVYCRHIGLEKRPSKPRFWLARVRLKNGKYRQSRLGLARPFHADGLSFEEATRAAENWFAVPDIQAISSTPYQKGVYQQVKYEKVVEGFTFGDAMMDYAEWKRVSGARTHFETNLSLINHHIIPRLGNVVVDKFNGRQFTRFCVDVLETPPKRGNQKPQPRVSLADLDCEALRKRKKTLNTLIGILRQALRIAWENSEVESERSWKCLKRLPHADTPRQFFLTRNQCKRLLAECRPDLRNLVLGALYTGCRVSELSNLRVRDVGGHFFGIYVAPMKTYRSRYVHLPEEGMSFFLDQCEGKDDEALVFETQSGSSWNGRHKHLFRDAVRAAGLPDGFVFHGLRHTYASQLVQAGTSLAIVAKQLGHSTTDTVSRTYGHLSCRSVEQELSKRFAPLRARRDDPRLADIQTALQSVPDDASGWPRRNFSQASGEIVSLFRQSFR